MLLMFWQDPFHWEVVDPLPSYGRGVEVPGGRYQSLINGYMLDDVVITGFFHSQHLFFFLLATGFPKFSIFSLNSHIFVGFTR